jgi:hypothetical protein
MNILPGKWQRISCSLLFYFRYTKVAGGVQPLELISLNARADPGRLQSSVSKKMADKQDKVFSPQPATTAKDIDRSDSKPTAGERRLQDALEDDEVREALKCLHSRDNSE